MSRVGRGDIRQLDITPVQGDAINITHIARNIAFYEDIFQPHITCNIDVLDGASLRSILPIIGGEVLDIDVGEPLEEKVRQLKTKMTLYRTSPRQRARTDLEIYSLYCVTPEHLMDGSLSVRNSYTKPIHEIVQDVVQTHFTPITGKKLVEVEETKGIHSFVPTGISPTAFIKQLMREAESLENPSSIYMFYETIEGYHFITLDKLYAKEATHKFFYDLSFEDENSPRAYQFLKNKIEHINFYNNFNIMDAEQFNIQTHHFDPLTKTFRTSDYNYERDAQQSKHSNKTIPSQVLQRNYNNATVSRFVITNAHRSENGYIIEREPTSQNIFRRRQDFMDRERATLRQYGNIRLTISVPGNSNVFAGETVQIVIPNASDSEEEKILNDPQYSGKYVVSAVAHHISIDNRYQTVLELLRPGFEEKLVNE